MPSAVEDFSYPNAARILQDQKIALKRGDGHITLTGCDSAHDIMVKSRTGARWITASRSTAPRAT